MDKKQSLWVSWAIIALVFLGSAGDNVLGLLHLFRTESAWWLLLFIPLGLIFAALWTVVCWLSFVHIEEWLNERI